MLGRAFAEDLPGSGGGQQPNPNGPRTAGPTVNLIDAYSARGPPPIPAAGPPTEQHGDRARGPARQRPERSGGTRHDASALVYTFETGSKGGLKRSPRTSTWT
jgi:hypothetical protein